MNKISFRIFSLPVLESKYFLKLLIILQLIIISCLNTQAEIRYVSKTGTSIPPYNSWEIAADSIQECIDISQPGDTIYVANGVYQERIIVAPGLTLIGSGIDSCIIDTRDLQPEGVASTLKDSSVFKNFRVRVSNFSNNNWTGIGILFNSYSPAKAEFNFISGAQFGIYSNVSNSLITHNIIDSSMYGFESAGLLTHKPILLDNLFLVKGTAINISFGTTPFIANNICVGGGFGGSYSGLNEIYNNLFIGGGAALSDTTLFVNNNIIFLGAQNNAIAVGGLYQTIKNNIIQNAYKAFFTSHPPGTNPIAKYNNVWESSINYQGIPPLDSTNIYKDPMFVNDTSDFHLQMYSPLIDIGDPEILDVDSSRSDIGIYGGPLGESYNYIDLAPREPRGVEASVDSNYSFITVKWEKNTEADFSYYNLFRDTLPDFIADSSTFIGSLTDTFYLHIIPPGADRFYYKLSSVDNQGNQSALSEEVGIILTSSNVDPLIVDSDILYQNYPNPFNPKTIIGYKLKEYGYVKLRVYDIKGEEVSLLVNEYQGKGYYETEFDASLLASGIYLYRIDIRNEKNIPVYTDMKKMLMVK